MKRKRILTILIVLMLCFIWGNSLLSREVSGWISDTIMEGLNWCAQKLGLRDDMFTVMIDQDGDGVAEPTSALIRKTAHVAEFTVLAALVWLRLEDLDRKRTPVAIAAGVLAGAVDETLQIFSHRGSQALDVCIDGVGVLLGVGVMLLWTALRQRTAVGTPQA